MHVCHQIRMFTLARGCLFQKRQLAAGLFSCGRLYRERQEQEKCSREIRTAGQQRTPCDKHEKCVRVQT